MTKLCARLSPAVGAVSTNNLEQPQGGKTTWKTERPVPSLSRMWLEVAKTLHHLGVQ